MTETAETGTPEPDEPVVELKFDCRGWPVSAVAGALMGVDRRFPGSTIRNGDGHYIITLGRERNPLYDEENDWQELLEAAGDVLSDATEAAIWNFPSMQRLHAAVQAIDPDTPPR